MADKKITQLPNNYPLTGTELLEIVQAADNKKVSLTAIATFIASTIPSGGTYTVDNGLTENPANNFQLGGTLTQSTTIDVDANDFDILSSTNTTTTLTVSNTNPTGKGLVAYSAENEGAEIVTNNVSNNTLKPVLKIHRSTSGGSGLSEIGGSIDYYSAVGIGMVPPGWVQEPDVRLAAVASDPDPTFNRQCRFEVWTNDSNSLNKVLTLNNFGQLFLESYGVGNFTATQPVYMLGVGPSGEVLENNNVVITFKEIFEGTELKNGATHTILPPPGVGYAWVVIEASAKYNFGTVAYNNLKVGIKPTTGTSQFVLLPTVFSTSTGNEFVTIDKESPSTGNAQIVENDSIDITLDPSATGSGGSLIVYGSARLITL